MDDYELEQMRASIEELFPSTCMLLTSTYASDGAGGGTLTWGTATADVSCRLDSKGGYEQLADGSVRPYQRLVLSMPYNTTITEAYRVEFDNETFLITSVTPLDTSWSLVKRVQLERLTS